MIERIFLRFLLLLAAVRTAWLLRDLANCQICDGLFKPLKGRHYGGQWESVLCPRCLGNVD